MSIIPRVLQDRRFRFTLVDNKSKRPLERNWQDFGSGSNYVFDDPKLLSHIEEKGAYGFLNGNGFLTIDCDSKMGEVAVKENLPSTFEVKSGGKKLSHLYYFCPGWFSNEVIKNGEGEILFEVRCVKSQTVAPNSVVNGGLYEVFNDVPIVRLERDKLQSLVDKFKKKESFSEVRGEFNNTFDVRLEDLINTSKFNSFGDELQGEHPLHGSKTGMNFCINTKKQLWHCFRCNSGGGLLHWVAVKEGILSCEDCTNGSLKGKKYFDVIKIANEKYNVKIKTTTFDNIEALQFYDEKNKLNANLVAEHIMKEYNIFTVEETGKIFYYQKEDGIYKNGENFLRFEIKNLVGNKNSKFFSDEVLYSIKCQTNICHSDLNQPLELIPLKNGIYNYKNGKIYDFSPDFHFMYKHPVRYDPISSCHKIENFLEQVVDKDKIQLMKEMIGYCFVRHYKFQYIFLLVGSGANGKSVFLNLLKKMLGLSNVSSLHFQELCNRFSKYSLYLKNANIAADLNDREFNDPHSLKEFSGSDMGVSAEIKFHSGHFNYDNYAKLIASCNKVPKCRDETDGWFRRWVIVNFPNSFVGRENRDLLGELCDDGELSAFFLLCMGAFKSAEESGDLSYAVGLAEKRENYLNLSDSVSAFCNRFLSVGDVANDRLEKSCLFDFYVRYCDFFGVKSKHYNVFFKDLFCFFGKDFVRNYSTKEGSDELGNRRNVHYVEGLVFDDVVFEEFVSERGVGL